MNAPFDRADRRPIEADLRKVAKARFGFDAFRSGQQPALEAVLEGKDVLAVLPTGAGKSAIYQNIHLGVRTARDAAHKQRALVAEVASASGPGIVYTATRRHAEEIASALSEEGIDAAFYHAGMNRAERAETEQRFLSGGLSVIVATPAFGMGIDKPDIRFVFHFDVTASLEAYYQEIGRSGRDGQPATALLFYRREDLHLHKFFASGKGLGADHLETVADAIRDAGQADAETLRETTDLSAATIARASTELEEQGLIARAPGDERLAPVDGTDFGDAPERLHAKQEERRRKLLERLDRMRIYAEMRDCRRRYLLEYFGQDSDDCGRCDNCEAGLPPDSAERSEHPSPLRARVAHRTLGNGMVIGYAGPRITILFDESGERTLDIEAVIERRLRDRL